MTLLNGVDRLEQYGEFFEGKKLGLITSPTGLSRSGETTIDILHKKYGLSALFSPEHGVRGNMAAGSLVDTYADAETGVPVYSLYRKNSKRLTPEMLNQVDAVVYDIQDVGARYYTFLYTMLYAMEDCSAAGKAFIILDRPNPLNGITIEGNILKENYKSFVGGYPLCMRYGLTVGEFARMADEQMNLHCDLHIIPCSGWKRKMQFPDYGSVWVPPSLNIPNFDSALLYPGMCLFEGTNYSEGRGTAHPFEVIGAPSADASRLAREMNRKHLPGVWFRPVYFSPTTSKHKDIPCEGVQIHIIDRHAIRSVDVGIQLLEECGREDPEFAFLPPVNGGKRRAIDLLGGDHITDDRIDHAEALLLAFHADSISFREQVQKYFIYPEE